LPALPSFLLPFWPLLGSDLALLLPLLLVGPIGPSLLYRLLHTYSQFKGVPTDGLFLGLFPGPGRTRPRYACMPSLVAILRRRWRAFGSKVVVGVSFLHTFSFIPLFFLLFFFRRFLCRAECTLGVPDDDPTRAWILPEWKCGRTRRSWLLPFICPLAVFVLCKARPHRCPSVPGAPDLSPPAVSVLSSCSFSLFLPLVVVSRLRCHGISFSGPELLLETGTGGDFIYALS
jgi:hypothetical protein